MKIEKFKETLIAFDTDNGMVNATDMAKQYGKYPADFLRLKQTQEFIKALESDMSENHITYEVVRGKYKDGRSQGTWMGEILALRFAAWLDPTIEVFVYKIFRDTLKMALNRANEKLHDQQAQLDYFWDKEDRNDNYNYNR